MARYSHLTIFQKSFDLVNRIYKEVHNFPREHKYTLGAKMQETSLELLDHIVAANSEENKKPQLKEAIQKINRLHIYTRLCYSLKVISKRKYEVLSKFIEEIGKMTGGWLKTS